ncbi:MAG: hypothetical protein Kow00107_07450 [Planctomycetota bacterium]
MITSRLAALSLSLLILFTVSASSEWIPGDWKLKGGTSLTSWFTIENASSERVFAVSTSIGNSQNGDFWKPSEDFSVIATPSGFSYSSEMALGRNKMVVSGRADRLSGDGIYFSFCATAEIDLQNLWLSFDIPAAGISDKLIFSDHSPAGMPNAFGEKDLIGRHLTFAEGHKEQIVLESSSRLPHRISFLHISGVEYLRLHVNITGSRLVAAGVPVFYTARVSPRDIAPAPYCSVVSVLTKGEIARYSVFEAAFQTLGIAMSDPHDIGGMKLVARFASEDRKTSAEVGPIYYAPFREAGEGDDRTMEPSGRPYFLVRYCPRNPGKYFWRLYAGGENGYVSDVMHFQCAEAAGGFVMVSPDDSRYLMLTSGKPYFPIGHNLGWVKPSVPSQFSKDIERMSSSGVNASRVWICTWGLNVDDVSEPFGFNHAALCTLDHLLSKALEEDMKIILVLTNAEDLDKNRDKLPYFAPGMATEREQFFTDERIVEMFRKRVAYLVNRYSPYSSLLAFEPGNELSYSTDMETYTAWMAKIVEEIRANDINHHLTTGSLGFNEYSADFWTKTGVELVQIHSYFKNPAFIEADFEKSALGMVEHFSQMSSAIGKPVFFAEFGFTESSDADSLSQADSQGVALSNSLWASLFNGMCGTAMNWWWDSYVFPTGQLRHYRSISRYLEGIDLPKENFELSKSTVADINHLSMRGKTLILGYLSAPDNNWVDLVAAQKTARLNKNITLDVESLGKGYARVEWWDTELGLKVSDFRTPIYETLTLKVPDFSRSLAYRILYERFE